LSRRPRVPRVALAVMICCSVVAIPGRAAAQQLTPIASPPTKGALYADGQTDRYLLEGAWLFRADPTGVGLAERWWANVASTIGWSPVAIPNAYNAGDFSNASMAGTVGWYRRDFTLPTNAFASYVRPSDRHWIIRFESINYRATVWLNGHLIGTHIGENLPFELDLTGVLPGVNRLIVRIDNRQSPAGTQLIPGYLPPGPGEGWWNFGGILREVYLRAVQRADISQVVVRPLLPCPSCAATIEEQVLVRNLTSTVQLVHLRGMYGAVPIDFGAALIAPRATWTATASVVISHPRLWSIDHPALYRATLALSDGARRPLAGYVTLSGIRSITVKGGLLFLNGRRLSLRGVELREQDASGAALSPAELRRLVGWVRALGATVIRGDPLNPEIEEMADRDGILIWSDIPASFWVPKPLLSNPIWLASAHAYLANDILTNENHPSLLVWSIADELPTPAIGSETAYIAGAAALAHRLDPTRPVGMAVSDWPGVGCQAAYAPLDVIGFNDYFGWFDAGGGATDDRDELGPFLDTFRACYPNKALFISEFGFDSNRNGPVEERGTYQFQADAIADHLHVFATKPWLAGAIYFVLQDAAAFPGFGGGDPFPVSPFNQKGLLDLQGQQKLAWGVVASIYASTSQIATAGG
jgi:beta-glucuronidase